MIRINLFFFFALSTFTIGMSYADNQRLTLSQVMEIAEKHYPEIEVQKARVVEAFAQRQSSPSLPPPTLFGTSMGSSGPFNNRMENSIGISQTIPFPTKLTSESDVKDFEAKAAQADLQTKVLDIRAEAKAVFFDLYGARKKISLLEEIMKIFDEHKHRVNSTTLSDRIMQAHRIWVQTELDLIQNEIIVAGEAEKIAQGNLNIVMGNDPFLPVPDLDDPPLSQLPDRSKEMESTYPGLQSLAFSQDAARASLHYAKSLWLPDISLSYRYADRLDGLMPNYSEVMAGVTLPFLFYWETKGQTKAAAARTREAESRIKKTRNDLNMRLLESRARAESLREQIKNYETKIVPQAEKRMNIGHGLVPLDMESLNEHRDAMESVVKLKLAALDLRINYEKAVAQFESLLTKTSSSQEDL